MTSSSGGFARWLIVLLLAITAIALSGCATVTTVTVTSHADGEEVYGSRTIDVEGSATGTVQVRVLLNGTPIGTATVTGGSYSLPVTLADNVNTVRVEAMTGAGFAELEIVFPWIDIENFQPMDVVIGQPNKTTAGTGTGADQLSSCTYAKPAYVNGILYVPDACNNRILGFIGLPTSDGEAADFVLGQSSFTNVTENDDDQDGVADANPSARTMYEPSGVASDGTRLFVADGSNGRVLIYDTLPTTNFAAADVVVAKPSMTASGHTPCSLDDPFDYVERIAVAGGKLIVPDRVGHRVLIWNSIPSVNGVPADQVLGQPKTGATCVANDDDQDTVDDGNPTARTLNIPWDVWSDGERLLVADYFNYRALLWNTFPTTNFAPADIVIGQGSMTTRTAGASATEYNYVLSLDSNGNQIVIGDYYTSRVLFFDAFPTTNGESADHVLGQNSFTNTAINDVDQDGVSDGTPSARTVGASYGVALGAGWMIVNDYFNSRYALYYD